MVQANNDMTSISTLSPPSEFICPLTKKVFTDPLMSKYGNNFERTAILEWLAAGNQCCPCTQKILRPSNLVSNKALKSKIEKWQSENKLQQQQESAPSSSFDDDNNDIAANFVGVVKIPPKRFICPLTKEIMKDPVMTRDGMTFERNAILRWLNDNECIAPQTGKLLRPSDLVSNKKLQIEICQWERLQNLDDKDDAYFIGMDKLNGSSHQQEGKLYPDMNSIKNNGCVKGSIVLDILAALDTALGTIDDA